MGERLARSFFRTDAATLARRLIGQRLVRVHDDGTRLAGVIHEVEAYVGVEDRASHAFGGRRTVRNASMFAREGTAYVYFTYGMHFCMNVVAGREGDPHAVLLRALVPEEGQGVMLERRGGREPLCQGPARLCQAMGIDKALDGDDLVEGERIYLERGRARAYGARELVACPRVGIGSKGGAWVREPLRWYVRGSPWVSVRDAGAEKRGRIKGGAEK